MSQSIFRAYDVRGIYGEDLDEKTAELLGKAFGTFIGKGKTVAVSRDVRNSGESLKKSFVSGLTSVGCDVVDLGMVTTPMMYFAVENYGLDAGVSVTASHNPPEWNGFKMTKNHGILCSEGMGMEEIRDIFLSKNFSKSERTGEVSEKEITEDYTEFLTNKVKVQKRLRVVLDPGNGSACNVCKDIFERAGHEVFVINNDPDGSFPSRPSDPKEENVKKLMEEVVRRKADLGIAFDGDADRVAMVDNLGRYVKSGNITIPIFSDYYIKQNNNPKIVFDVCCSSYVEESIRKNGGEPIASKVGHSFVMNKMKEVGAVFGGEYSNHLYFSDLFGFDDALYAGLKMTEILSNSGRKLSEIVDEIPKYPASEVREVQCNDDDKFEIVSRIGEEMKKNGYKVLDIDGVKAFDEDGGWVLIRGSNTMPVIKFNSEAKTEEKMRELLSYADKIIRSKAGG